MNNDPMDQPEPRPDPKDIPREILTELMTEYEQINARSISILKAAADRAPANMGLVSLVSAHAPTLEYLVARGIQVFLETQTKFAYQQLRASVEGILDMADMMREAARASGADD